MRAIIQNIQKHSNLASDLHQSHEPDMMLLQEINWRHEDTTDIFNPRHNASNTSVLGFGTAIYSKKENQLSNIRHVSSPHAEMGGFIHKLTTVATLHIVSDGQTIPTRLRMILQQRRWT